MIRHMKHIKNLLYLLIPIVLCSCPEKLDYWTAPSTTELHCSSSISNLTLQVSSNEGWTITCSSNWIYVNPSKHNGTGAEDKTEVKVSVDPNQKSTERVGELILVGTQSGERHTILVVQEGKEEIKYFTSFSGESTFTFDQQGGSFVLDIQSNEPWTLSPEKSWCLPSLTKGDGSTQVEVLVRENPNADARSSKLVLLGQNSDTEIPIIVAQSGSAQPASIQIGKDEYGIEMNLDDKAKFEFSVTPSSLGFGSSGGQKSIEVSGNDSWTASSSASWCALSRTSGTGASSINATVSKNTSTSSRSATITLRGSKTGKTVTVSVSQSQGGTTVIGKDEFGSDSDLNGSTTYSFSAGPASLSYASAGGQKSIEVSGNDSWTASSSASWCALSRTSGTGASNINVTVSKNTSTSSRSATITLKGSKTGKTVTVNVSQSQGGSTVIGKGEFD